jgi:hypothetical protein
VIRFPDGAPAADPSTTDRGASHPSAGSDERDPAYDRFTRAIVDACRGLDDASERQWLLDALWRSRHELLEREREGDAIRAGLGGRFSATLVETLAAEIRRDTGRPSNG